MRHDKILLDLSGARALSYLYMSNIIQTNALELLFSPTQSITVGNDSYADCIPVEAHSAASAGRGPFFSINSFVVGQNFNDKTEARSPKADINVNCFQNFLFESDLSTITLQEQLKALKWLAAQTPIRLITYSGNKSYHVIISLNQPLPVSAHNIEAVSTYKHVWKGLCLYLEGLLDIYFQDKLGANMELTLFFDRATSNPSRSSRLPGYIRPDTGKTQTVEYIGPHLDLDFALNLKLSSDSSSYQEPLMPHKSFQGLEDFESAIQSRASYRGLRTKSQMPRSWVKSQGMYGEMLKLTLWAIDLTGVTYPIWNMYLQKHTYPALIEVGYPRYKLELGPRNAYRYKQRRFD